MQHKTKNWSAFATIFVPKEDIGEYQYQSLCVMTRTSRENAIEEKQRMRNNRNKRKIILRAEEKRKAADILRQKERAEYSHAKELARFYYGKRKDLAR